MLAGAPSRSYRLKKLVARHRILVTTAAVVLASLMVATAVSLTFAVRANDAEILARNNLQLAQRSQKLAETERDRALTAEARIRELEQASRLEASTAQAAVRFLNQEKTENKSGSKADADSPPIQPLRIKVETNGNITMFSENGEFTLEFAVRSRDAPLAKSTRSRIRKLNKTERQQARKLLLLVAEEMRKRFGRLDLYVAEPLMMLVEMDLQDKNWKSSERRIRHISALFANNFSRRELRFKNQLLLALTQLRQDPESSEAIRYLSRSHQRLAQLPSMDAGLRKALVGFGHAFNERNKITDQTKFDASLKKAPRVAGERGQRSFQIHGV